jgi:hypothetical protein
MSDLTRRVILGAPLGAAALLSIPARFLQAEQKAPHEAFPSHLRSRVYDTVLWAHSDTDKVGALVEASPSLANAAMDWGFGDWETAIGAASHMGRRDMAQLLLDHGARPDIFTFTMMGNLGAVKAAVEARPGVQSTFGPHGISLLAHAKSGGEESLPVVKYLEAVGDADPSQADEELLLGLEAYTGTYAFGPNEDQQITVSERRGSLGLVYRDGFPKILFHVGNHEFHTTGAMHVRVRFAISGEQATGLSIFDPDLVLAAERVGN